MPDLPDTIADLWDDWLAGIADDARTAALLAWIKQHPDALPGLRHEASMDLALGYRLAPDGESLRLRDAVMARLRTKEQEPTTGAFARRVMGRVQARRRTRRPAFGPPALAAAALLAVAAAWYLSTLGSARAPAAPAPANKEQTAPEPAAATVIAHRGRVTVGDRTVAPGTTEAVPDGAEIAVANGSADLHLADGSVMTLIDDARLHAGADAWKLVRGTLAVEAAPQPPGHRLAIATAHATVSVVGTSFRVEAGVDDTWVAVAHGRVEVAGATTRMLGAGEDALADARGVGVPSQRRVLTVATAMPNDLFDPVTLLAQSGAFHGLALARFTYQPTPGAAARFADVAWPIVLATDERRATLWIRPLSVDPAARMDGTIVAITAGLDDCDYLLAERHVAAGERGWLRLEADLAAGRLNWTRPGAVAQPLRAESIRRLSLRAYCGYIDAVVTVPVIER